MSTSTWRRSIFSTGTLKGTSQYNEGEGPERSFKLGTFLKKVFSKYGEDGAFVKAQALAYTSLLSLVPVTALTFLLFSRFKSFSLVEEKLRNFIFKTFLPPQSEKVQIYIQEFLKNTTSLSFFGIISLILTALLLLETIERTFNEIWGVKTRRPLLRRFVAFWGFLTLAPILLGLSFTITTIVGNYIPLEKITFLSRFSYYTLPLVFAFLGFFIGYYFLPYTEVELKGVLIGSAVASLMWETAKYGFDWYINNMAFIGRIYGSLGLIPVFLVWLYLVWLIILFGAEIAVVYEWPYEEPEESPYWSLEALFYVSKKFEDEGGLVRYRELMRSLGFTRKKLSMILKPLVQRGWLHLTEEGVVLLVSPDKIKLHELLEAVDLPETAPPSVSPPLKQLSLIIRTSSFEKVKKYTVKEALSWR